MSYEHNIKERGIFKLCLDCSRCIVIVAATLFSALFAPVVCRAGEELDYDIISIYLDVRQVGSMDVQVIIRDEQLYLPVVEVFNFLKIKNTFSDDMNIIAGFLIDPQATFTIDKVQNRITSNGQVFDLRPDGLIRDETGLYLKADYFGKAFGLNCTFSFRSLSAVIVTKLDLPVIREIRREMMRRNISRLKHERMADTTIQCDYPLFRLGIADWSAVVSRQLQGNTDARLNLSMGAALAGGDATVALNYQHHYPFAAEKQYYLWRYVNNDQRFLRQIKIGTIPAQAVSTLLAPVLGVQVSNTPSTYRQSFGNYMLSRFTEPNWTVELYVNNVLVDYTQADGSGLFTFEIPLVYGNSQIRLRFYGPWGEERSSEENIIIPFSLIPRNELEYTVSAGTLTDNPNSQFARMNLNYGLSRRITVGAGVEYLSSLASSQFMPFLNTTFKAASNLLVSMDYMHRVRSKGAISYRLQSDLQFELNYIKYEKGQQAINSRSLEERKIIMSIPLRTPAFVMFSRLTVNQIIAPQAAYDVKTKYKDIPKTQYTSADLMLSGAFRRMSASLTSNGLFIGGKRPHLYSELALAYRLPAGFAFKPMARFQHEHNRLMTAKCELEKQLRGKGFLNMSYERNFYSKFTNIMIGISCDLSLVRTTFLTSHSNRITTFMQSAAGSLVYNRKAKYANLSSRPGIGRAGIIIAPYLDLNGNDQKEINEPKVSGLQVRINEGTMPSETRDTIIPVFNLEPYTNYHVELDDNSLGSVAWQIKNKTMNVTVGANQLKLIEVPVAVKGEASGTVYLKEEGKEQKGLERIVVFFYNRNGVLAGKTITEPDGFFSYMGLSPGSYTARIDEKQLDRLKLVCSSPSQPFTVVSSVNGAVVEGLDFTLSPLP